MVTRELHDTRQDLLHESLKTANRILNEFPKNISDLPAQMQGEWLKMDVNEIAMRRAHHLHRMFAILPYVDTTFAACLRRAWHDARVWQKHRISAGL